MSPEQTMAAAAALVLPDGWTVCVVTTHSGTGRVTYDPRLKWRSFPVVDVGSANEAAWALDVRDLATAYVVDHGIRRGVIHVKVMVLLAGRDGGGDVPPMIVQSCDVGARYVAGRDAEAASTRLLEIAQAAGRRR